VLVCELVCVRIRAFVLFFFDVGRSRCCVGFLCLCVCVFLFGACFPFRVCCGSLCAPLLSGV
jgi:hypothetical protein